MVKKVIPLVLFGLLFSTMPKECFADASAQLEQAETYRTQGQYEQAEAIYQQIVTDFPDSNDALEAQKQLTILYIKQDNRPQAESAYQQLLANFPAHKDIAQAVHDIAYQYRLLQKYDKANQLDQYVVDNWPQDDYAVLAQMDLTKYYVNQGNDTAAQAAIDKLLANFSNSPLIARAVHDVAQHYRWSGKYEKANELYQHVIDNWPKAEHALWSQADLIKSNVALGDDVAAEAAVDKLLTNFTDNPFTARAVWDTGQLYRGLKKYQKANELYQHAIDNWPKTEHALWSQADLIKSYLALGDDPNAEAAVDKLLANFTDNPLIVRAIHDTAYEYRKLQRYEKADELDQYVINKWPDDEQTMWAKMDVAKSNIVLGNDAAAETTINILIADFNDHPDLAQAIFRIGESYYNEAFRCENQGLDAEARENFQKAIAVWGKIITELPPSATTPEAYDFVAVCYRRLGEYENAIEYYSIVVDNWPDYQYAWDAQFRIARCFEKLARSGRIPKADAAAQICQACEKLLTDYPDCKAVKAARNLLDRWNAIKP